MRWTIRRNASTVSSCSRGRRTMGIVGLQIRTAKKNNRTASQSRPRSSQGIALLVAILANPFLTPSAASQQPDLVTDINSSANETLENAGKFLVTRTRGVEPALLYEPFNLSTNYVLFALPVSYNTNPELVHSRATHSFRFDPKIQGRAGTKFDQGDVSLTVSADLDRYPSLSSANSNGFVSVEKLRFSKLVPNQPITPYILHQLSIRATPRPPDITSLSNDLGGGTSVALATWKSGTADWTPGVDISATRRFVMTGSNSTSIAAKTSIAYNDHESFDASFSPSFRVRWFDRSTIGARRDTTVIFPFQAGWYPNALCNFWDGLSGSLQFSVNATRNFSNVE